MSTAVETPPPPISEWKVVRGGLVVGAGMLAGQMLGFLRQATIAYSLGTGPQADAIAVAFAPVDLLWAVLSTAVVFGFGPALAAGEHRAAGASFRDLARPVVGSALLIAALFILLARGIVRVLAPGLDPSTVELAIPLLRITALALPAVAWSMVFTALLYSERRFGFGAFHNGLVNLCIIVTAVALETRLGPYAFVLGYAGGTWLQLGIASMVARRLVTRSAVPPHPAGMANLSALFGQPAPILFYSVLIGLNPVVTRALASHFGHGATAAFDYCLKLLGVPLGLLVIPLSSSLLSEIAPFRQRQDRSAALGAIRRAAIATALAAGVVVLLMTSLGPWVVALLFERGRFTASSTAFVSSLLAGFFPALAAWSVLDVISRSLFSLGRPRVPILAAAVALAVNGLVSWLAPAAVAAIGLGAVAGFAAAAALVAFHLRGLRRE